MKPPINSLSALIALSTAAASAGIVGSPFPAAEMILTEDLSLDIDMDGDGTNNYTIKYDNSGGYIITGETNNEIFILDDIDFSARSFALGEEIALSATSGGTACWTNLIGTGHNYLGVKFQIAGQTNSGWIQLYLPDSVSGILVRGAWENTPGAAIPAGGASATVIPSNGPLAGGNTVLITNAEPRIGLGGDITNILVGGAGTANISGQGVDWVAFSAPSAGSAGVKDIVIQAASAGPAILLGAYTYTAKTNLPTPQITSATYGTYTNMVRVTWLGVDGAVSYDILRNTTNNFDSAALLTNVSASQGIRGQSSRFSPQSRNRSIAESLNYFYDDYAVVPRQSYYYWVRAHDATGVSELSRVGLGYAELGSAQTVGRADLLVYDLVFLPVNLTNGSTAGTASYRLANLGPDALSTAPVRFDFYMVQDDQEAWLASIDTNMTLAVDEEQLIVASAAERAGIRVCGGLAGRWTFQARVRHRDLIGDERTGSNMTDAAGTVLVRAVGVNSIGRGLNDYDGDGKADLALCANDMSAWVVASSGSRYKDIVEVDPGQTEWEAAPGDYEGADKTGVGVYVPIYGLWNAWFSADGGHLESCVLGGPGFTAAPCDFDGDAKTDPVVYREADGLWIGAFSSQGYALGYASLGGAGYQPVIADYDGDGLADPAVYDRETGRWLLAYSGNGYQVTTDIFGGAGYEPAVADYDGDGLADPAVFEAASGKWQVLMSGSEYALIQVFLQPSAYSLQPVPADYDGDGKADFAVYYQATGLWKIFLSASGYQEVSGFFGGAGYRPVAE